MQHIDSGVLGKVAMVNLEIHVWSGRKKLIDNDIRGVVPPKKLASLGSKRIVDPKRIAKFESLRRSAERLLSAHGVRIMGSYAIPVEKMAQLNNELNDLQNEFYTRKRHFIQEYDTEVENWINEQEEWGEIIRSAITPASVVQTRMSFDWQIFHLQPTGNEDVDSNLNDRVGTMGGKLFSEIADQAAQLLEKQYLMRDKVLISNTATLFALHEKLRGLSFLDSKAGVISSYMGDVLASLPAAGCIEGEQLRKIVGLLVILSDRSRLDQFGSHLVSGGSFTDLDLIQSAKDDAGFDTALSQSDLLAQTETPTAVTGDSDEDGESDISDDDAVTAPPKAPSEPLTPAVWF